MNWDKTQVCKMSTKITHFPKYGHKWGGFDCGFKNVAEISKRMICLYSFFPPGNFLSINFVYL